MTSIKKFLDTKLDKTKTVPLVFTTKVTLNERFTVSKPRCLFVINNGFTAPNKDNMTGRVVFNNQRSKDLNKRFTGYKYKQLDKNKNEDLNKLERELKKVAKRRRTVMPPPPQPPVNKKEKSKQRSVKAAVGKCSTLPNLISKSSKSVANQTVNDQINAEHFAYNSQEKRNVFHRNLEQPMNNCNNQEQVKDTSYYKQEQPKNIACYYKQSNVSYGKQEQPSTGYYNHELSNVSYGRREQARSTGYHNYEQPKNIGYSNQERPKNITDGSHGPAFAYNRSWTGEIKSSYYNSVCALKNSENFQEKDSINRRFESLISSPFHYFGSPFQYVSIRKPDRPTKEQLDEEIDRYMAEIKCKAPETETEDIDSFVEEYMIETEKCIKQNESIQLQ